MRNKYFSGLNYTLGNEDSNVEIELIKKIKPKKIFSICGSGGRSLPLVHELSEEITLADLSKEQLMLAELRLASYRHLLHDEFLLFWGYYPYEHDNHRTHRKELFLRLNLTSPTHDFFSIVFNQIGFHSLLYLGKWERTFQVFAKINRMFMGRDYDLIMHFDNLDEQVAYYRNSFPLKRWKILIHILGNKAMFNALLYKGDFITKNSALSHFDYYFQAFDRLFTRDLAQKSFFLQLCFYGKIQSLSGVPVEASLDCFERVRASTTFVQYVQEDFVSFLSKGVMQYDFLSLSDVPSYFQGDLERDFMQKIKPGLAPGAIIVNRYYLRKSACLMDGFIEVTDEYRNLIELEKVQMYDICIYKYQPS